MIERERITLIDWLRALPTETEWFEFKRNRYEPQQLGEYLSALANAACLAGQPCGYRGRRSTMKKLRNRVEKRCFEVSTSSKIINNQYLVALLRRAPCSCSSKGSSTALMNGASARVGEGCWMPAGTRVTS